MKFTASTRLYIAASLTTKTLSFKISEAQIDDLSFEPVDKYVVKNIELAEFKATQVLKKVENSNVFGTGFPSPTRHNPKIRVERDWVFSYDNSHIDLKEE